MVTRAERPIIRRSRTTCRFSTAAVHSASDFWHHLAARAGQVPAGDRGYCPWLSDGNAVDIDKCLANKRSDDPNTLLDIVYRNTVKIELVPSAGIAAQCETTTVS